MRLALLLSVILLPAAPAAAQCRGPVSPDDKSIACMETGNSFSVRDREGNSLWKSQLPLFTPSSTAEPFAIRISTIFWSPDSSKILIAAPYHGIHEIYTVYDVGYRMLLRQIAANNFLSWLPDSRSYLSHNSYEGFCGEIEVNEEGRYRPSLTFYRNTLDGEPRTVWGKATWKGRTGGVLDGPGVMTAVIRITALDQGRRIRARVENAEGKLVTVEGPSKGEQVLSITAP